MLRRLHSLSGIVPIGAFLVEHYISNAEAMKGPAAYNATVRFLNSLPFVLFLEWGLIFIPILYHGLYGLYIWYRGEANVSDYPWIGNWMYSMQRWTGGIAFAYASTRSTALFTVIPGWWPFTSSEFLPHPGTSLTASGCFVPSGGSPAATMHAAALATSAWRLVW